MGGVFTNAAIFARDGRFTDRVPQEKAEEYKEFLKR
jgi:hypothetical protein